MPKLREDLNGLRVKLPGHPAIYLMDLGKKRHIPNPTVYNELFKDWGGIVEDINIDDIETGNPIPETAILFRCHDNPKVFLLDGNVKRHIVDESVLDRYYFNPDIHVWPVPLNAIGFPDGTPIKNPF